jgi:hypothetical protein
VLNRLSIKSGDIVDIREVRNSERRLKASQLFLTDPAQGIAPEIVVKPNLLGDDASSLADQSSPGLPAGSQIRGQSPDGSPAEVPTRSRPATQAALADLQVNVKLKPDQPGSVP